MLGLWWFRNPFRCQSTLYLHDRPITPGLARSAAGIRVNHRGGWLGWHKASLPNSRRCVYKGGVNMLGVADRVLIVASRTFTKYLRFSSNQARRTELHGTSPTSGTPKSFLLRRRSPGTRLLVRCPAISRFMPPAIKVKIPRTCTFIQTLKFQAREYRRLLKTPACGARRMLSTARMAMLSSC
jgi:hypothetical protein